MTSQRSDRELCLVRWAEAFLAFEALSLAALVDRPLGGDEDDVLDKLPMMRE